MSRGTLRAKKLKTTSRTLYVGREHDRLRCGDKMTWLLDMSSLLLRCRHSAKPRLSQELL